MPVYRGAGGAGDATNDATVTAVQAAATAAATSATNAANSATAAATSASGAATSATNAANSATTAAGQATTAAGHATNASTFATNSSLSADDSADSATEAEGYASEAFDYKVEASVSAASAASSASSATASQLAAETAALAVDDVLTDPDFITVLGLSDELQTVANNSANITAVANNAANINAVEANETNIDLVAANVTDIGVVAELEVDIDTVAGISANVTTVAGISANVTNVANNSSNINAVAGNATNINAVNANATNINTVAGINANVTTVAGNTTNINAVATNNANVTTVAGSIANVNTNATNIANINQNAANIVAIQNASANATAAASSATAAAGSATSASASAAAASAVALGNEPVRHSVRPSLLLDFANTKTLDPRITFTRASTGTFYDGKTVAKAEENLVIRSEEFDNASWGKNNATVTANSTTSPDGNTTAELVYPSTTGAFRGIFQQSTSPYVTTAVAKVFSIYAKASGFSHIYLIDAVNGNQKTFFNVSTGTVGTTAASTTASIVDVGNGWYRCIVSTSVAWSSGGWAGWFLADADNSTTATTNGTDGVFFWGAQLEQRSSVTAYTVTTTAPITNYIPALQSALSGVARFEHNPITGESLGLEIEEQRTNLVTYSDDLSNAAWTKTQSTITSNTIVAPDGTLTGDKLVENTATSEHQVRQSATASNVAHTFSVYLKAGERTSARVDITDLSTGQIDVIANLSTGTLGAVSSGGSWSAASATITSVGNGWYRVTVTGTKGGGSFAAGTVNLISGTSTVSYAGNGFNGIYIWGAQLEAGAFATSYIPTVASQVTRSADAASMTGTNFSSWYRADEGTIYGESVPASIASNSPFYALSDSSGTNQNTIYGNQGTSSHLVVRVNNATVVNLDGGTYVDNTTAKSAGRYKRNDFALSLNAGTVVTDTDGLLPLIDRLFIGGNSAGQTSGAQTIKKLSYYPKALTSAELQGMTTV